MVEKIKKRLDSYLGFDSDLIFQCGDPVIFGGAIRDSISDLEIHDVDILVGPKTSKLLSTLLIKKGYSFQSKLVNSDIIKMYGHLERTISLPYTYINNRGRVIQLIRPVGTPRLMKNTKYANVDVHSICYKDIINEVVNQVDLSCCGISYNGSELKESFKNAIIHCLHGVYIINYDAAMKTDRLVSRCTKLNSRGWAEITHNDQRELLIDHICI